MLTVGEMSERQELGSTGFDMAGFRNKEPDSSFY